MNITEKEIETMVLGINENETAAWDILRRNWNGGALIMPQDELERRKAYRLKLKEFFVANNITAEAISDQWLAGKVRRILGGGGGK